MKLFIVDDQMETYRQFAFDLQRIYPEMQIEYATTAPNAIDRYGEIKPELIILDQVMGGGDNNGTAFLQWLSEQPASRPFPQIIFVTAHYNEIPASQILETNVPITLFIQKGMSFFQMLMIGVQLVIRKIDDKPHYTPTDLFGDKFVKLILEETQQIEGQHQPGYLTRDQQIQISTLIRSYMRSLETRSNWDNDDIMDVSIFFAEGLCRIFDLPNEPVEVLRRFLNIEEILYTIPHYRDHFFHQIKVFLLGFCIINALNRNNRLKGTILENNDGMKLWFIASAFHDIGYPFEKMSRWLENFIEGVLRNPRDTDLGAIIPAKLPWGYLLSRRYHAFHIKRIVERVCSLYDKQTPEVNSEVLSGIMSQTIEKADHGIFSSLIVQNILGGKIIEDEISPVALSIALHNAEVAELVRHYIGPQTLEKDPLSFLLAFCDLAQDWGRTRPTRLGSSGYQRFGFPIFDCDTVFDQKRGIVQVELLYNWRMPVSEVAAWRTEIFYKFIRPMRDWWMVGPPGNSLPKFCIQYRNQDGTMEELEF